MKIDAILSDYDGTLCPTTSLTLNNSLPEDLHNILCDISQSIPVCIVSSKDFTFLESCSTFAVIISSIMGIETFFLQKNKKDFNNSLVNYETISYPIDLKDKSKSNSLARYRIKQKEKLIQNSSILEDLSSIISQNFQDIKILKKYTHKEKLLAGVSFDYRHLLKWESYKINIEPRIVDKIYEYIKINLPQNNKLYIQEYLTHPFLDIYSIYCNKGDIVNEIRALLDLDRTKNILYLGDSENDNSAFRNADLSINIKSDERLNTKLDSYYSLEFNQLSYFLIKLHKENFNFTSMSM
ncbi:MAG TPA: HAD hydrolase family protein [Nitrososphaeraceae archaeon]|jgi:HAD superfamily hydrolase (TIGR01484 family)|nr:HAD hydrolase family protein [Nitrososphaeraceae archaeon]